jgi:putative Holliday junction resolvase
MRVLGLDLGARRIGVALSDEGGSLASGLPTLDSIGSRRDLNAVAALVRTHAAGAVVVGLPLLLDGSSGPQAAKVMAFVEGLRRRVRVPVVTWDERLTTVAAHDAMIEAGVRRERRRGLVDQIAAVLILQGYLDSRSDDASRQASA